MQTPTIIAHRGYSTRFRENSPAAWQGAMDARADVIEVDLRVSADGQIVCAHDATLERLAGRPERIAETTATELARIQADGMPAVPPLSLLFDVVPQTHAIVFDIKDERPAVLHGVIEKLLVQASDRALALGLHRAQSVELARNAGWTGDILGLLVDMSEDERFFAAGGNVIRLWESIVTEAAVRKYAARDQTVWVTTGEGTTGRAVGEFDATALINLARFGVNGFLVNDPDTARRTLESEGT